MRSIVLFRSRSYCRAGMYRRGVRFKYLGLMNEPGFQEAAEPDEFGLCLDRTERTAPDFDEKVYGRATGVLGLRLYPNPNFKDAVAERKGFERAGIYGEVWAVLRRLTKLSRARSRAAGP